MSPDGFGSESYAVPCLILIYTKSELIYTTAELVREAMIEIRLSQRAAEESSVVRHSLEIFLKAFKKKKTSAVGVLQCCWGWFCDLGLLMFKLLCHHKSRLYVELHLHPYFHKSVVYSVGSEKANHQHKLKEKEVTVECGEIPSTTFMVIWRVSAVRAVKRGTHLTPPFPVHTFLHIGSSLGTS